MNVNWRFAQTSPTLPRVFRLAVVISLASLTLVAGAAFGSSAPRHAAGRSADTVALWAKSSRGGPWRRTLSFKLHKLKLSVFYVCATYNTTLSVRDDCSPDEVLPSETFLRIEQTPIKRAQKRADSPGWGLVAMGPTRGPRGGALKRGERRFLRDLQLPRDAAERRRHREGHLEPGHYHLAPLAGTNATSSGTAPGRPTPAPASSRSPATAGHEFTPARSRVCQSTEPSAVESP